MMDFQASIKSIPDATGELIDINLNFLLKPFDSKLLFNIKWRNHANWNLREKTTMPLISLSNFLRVHGLTISNSALNKKPDDVGWHRNWSAERVSFD